MTYYVWNNGDCQNKTENLSEARLWEKEFLEDGGEDTYILDEDGVVIDEFFEATEEQILANLQKLNTKDIEDIVENYSYEWDENESTSRNLRELAEVIFNRES